MLDNWHEFEVSYPYWEILLLLWEVDNVVSNSISNNSSEIITYTIKKHRGFQIVTKMLDQIFAYLTEGNSPILHSN